VYETAQFIFFVFNLFNDALNWWDSSSSVICQTTGPQPLPTRFLHWMRSRASSFKWEYPLLSARSSSNCLRLPLLFCSPGSLRFQYFESLGSLSILVLLSSCTSKSPEGWCKEENFRVQANLTVGEEIHAAYIHSETNKWTLTKMFSSTFLLIAPTCFGHSCEWENPPRT
jgi:hypothetical protein